MCEKLHKHVKEKNIYLYVPNTKIPRRSCEFIRKTSECMKQRGEKKIKECNFSDSASMRFK